MNGMVLNLLRQLPDVPIDEEIKKKKGWFGLVWFMVVNITFNNISVILWSSVLLVEETGVPVENQRTVTSN
jgi:hypothetical protein